MKILIVHTYYRQKGGEDFVVEQEKNLLSTTEEVEVLTFTNQGGLKGALQFFLSIWNIGVKNTLTARIKEFQPDVIHLHNWHFAAGPIIIRTAYALNVPIVHTIHNYRLLCPSAILMHNNQIYNDSLTAGFPWKAIKLKLYRNSAIQTFWLAFVIWVHKKAGTWNMVSKYIVLTDFAKDIFLKSSFGINVDKFVVKPNFVSRPMLSPRQKESCFLFIGRLTEEKGIGVLLNAFSGTDLVLHIIGEGPMEDEVKQAAQQNVNIKYLGYHDKEFIYREIQQATALVFPSIWYEGMPMTILEAFALGTPVIASRLGAMESMIIPGYNGMCFEPQNKLELLEQVNYFKNLENYQKQEFEINVLKDFDSKYTTSMNKITLLNIYAGSFKKISAHTL